MTIILTICYEANREPTPDELGGFKDTAEDGLPDHYTASTGLQLNYLWAECALAEQQVRIVEAARAFAAVTAGLESTEEGAALLCALKQLEAMND